jgi:phytoene dehydrogenase-like protein
MVSLFKNHLQLSIIIHVHCRYVLLHHVMGELEGVKNAWGYPEGGTGAVSMAIARAAQAHGAVIKTDSVSVCVCE